MPSTSNPRSRRLLSAWIAVMLLLLWWPGGGGPDRIGWFPVDLTAHVGLFLPFGLLVAADREARGGGPLAALFAVLLAATFLGALSEAGQAWIPGRSASGADLAADLLGAMAGWVIGRFRGGAASIRGSRAEVGAGDS